MIEQDYVPISEVCRDMRTKYLKKLTTAVSSRNKELARVYMSVIAVLDPVGYKDYVDKKKRK